MSCGRHTASLSLLHESAKSTLPLVATVKNCLLSKGEQRGEMLPCHYEPITPLSQVGQENMLTLMKSNFG